MIAPADPRQGVFETMLVRDGRVQALDSHLQRLAASAAELYGRELPPGLAERVRAVAARTRAGAGAAHRLRLDLVPGARLSAEIRTTPLPAEPPRAHICSPVTVDGGYGPHKWRDRGRLGTSAGDRPVPLLIDGGTVLEAAWGNFWTLHGDLVTTPPADGRLLAGITRARLLELAPSLDLQAREAAISLDEARAAPAAFLTSSLQLAAITIVDGGAGPPPRDAETVLRIRAALLAGDWDD